MEGGEKGGRRNGEKIMDEGENNPTKDKFFTGCFQGVVSLE